MPVDDQRAIALLVGPDAKHEALQRRAVELISSWAAGALPDRGRARCLVRVDGAPLAGTHFDELCPDLAPWDVALDVWAPTPEDLPTEWCRDLAGDLGDLIDPTRSSVMAGPQWRARKPPAALGLTFCVTRKADLTHDEYVDHWRNKHAMIPLPMLRTFCQFYVDADRSAALAELAGLPPAATTASPSRPTATSTTSASSRSTNGCGSAPGPTSSTSSTTRARRRRCSARRGSLPSRDAATAVRDRVARRRDP